jgi:predicted short-subunit dehydrogenase-like oxidoreductase (DUF2520 family)
MKKKDTIAILGLGKVGTAIGFLLRSSGYDIVAVASRSNESINRGIQYTGGKAYKDFPQAGKKAECIIITTSDDVIASVCEDISKNGGVSPGDKVIHMSGVGGLDLLEPARKAGAYVGSIHPIQAFADVKGAIENIPGTTFGITAQDEIKNWAVQIVKDLGGSPFFVSDSDKPLYHAAACMASNYLVTLMNIVVEIYQSLGLKDDDAIKAFWPLVRGTIKNIEEKGTVQSLTGPVSRGDTGTVKKHIQAFQNNLPEFLNLYREMGVFTVDTGQRKKSLSEKKAEEIKSILMGD